MSELYQIHAFFPLNQCKPSLPMSTTASRRLTIDQFISSNCIHMEEIKLEESIIPTRRILQQEIFKQYLAVLRKGCSNPGITLNCIVRICHHLHNSFKTHTKNAQPSYKCVRVCVSVCVGHQCFPMSLPKNTIKQKKSRNIYLFCVDKQQEYISLKK